MLVAQLDIEGILEFLEGVVLLAGNGNGGGLVFARVRLDLVLQRVVIDVVQTPARYGFLFKVFPVFHGYGYSRAPLAVRTAAVASLANEYPDQASFANL